MITLIPALEVMKSVLDKNIASGAANVRRQAFTKSNDLMSLNTVSILIDGIIYEKISIKLNEQHRIFFESTYKIDNSARGITTYNSIMSVNFIAKSESRKSKVIILTENPSRYYSSNEIIVITPSDFLNKIKTAELLFQTKFFSSLEDALVAVFFVGVSTTNNK